MMKDSIPFLSFTNTTRQRHGAFTLTELLVVMAIIGLLASLLMPMLSRALALTRATACLSGMRQVYLGFTMYLDDYHHTPYRKTAWSGWDVGWKEILHKKKYARVHYDIYQPPQGGAICCPVGIKMKMGPHYRGQYNMNVQLSRLSARVLNATAFPSTTVWIVDGCNAWADIVEGPPTNITGWSVARFYEPPYNYSNKRMLGLIHTFQSNAIFLAGNGGTIPDLGSRNAYDPVYNNGRFRWERKK